MVCANYVIVLQSYLSNEPINTCWSSSYVIQVISEYIIHMHTGVTRVNLVISITFQGSSFLVHLHISVIMDYGYTVIHSFIYWVIHSFILRCILWVHSHSFILRCILVKNINVHRNNNEKSCNCYSVYYKYYTVIFNKNTIVLVYNFEEENNIIKINNLCKEIVFIIIIHVNKTTSINYLHINKIVFHPKITPLFQNYIPVNIAINGFSNEQSYF